MEVFITRSKYVAETISIFADFSLVFPTGVTITGLPTIDITMDWGTDPTPSSIIYSGASVSNGLVVEQRIRLGVPGDIYSITITVTGSDGDIYKLTTRLAILPNEGSAVPNWLPVWETTQLYPIESSESYISNTPHFIAGTLQQIIINYSLQESYISNFPSFVSGTLYETVIPYNYDYDSYKSSTTFIAGTLVSVLVTYSNDYDSYKNATAFISGTLTVVVIPYSLEEQYTSSSSFVSGTLT